MENRHTDPTSTDATGNTIKDPEDWTAYSTKVCHPIRRKAGSWPLCVMSNLMSDAARVAAVDQCRLDHTSGASTSSDG